MDYATRHYPHNGGLNLPHCSNSYYTERNNPLLVSHSPRGDPRVYPIGGPVGGQRGRGGSGRNEGHIPEAGNSRRRIAVACARCRKRKIRCTGDPGDGSGCQNCRSAGADPSQCVFHRVGSDNAAKVLDNMTITQSFPMIPYHSGSSNPVYAKTLSGQYPQLDDKTSIFPNWPIPCSGDTSPVETYGLDQTGSYMNTPGLYQSPNRWNEAANLKGTGIQHGAIGYLEQNCSLPEYQPTCVRTKLRNSVTNESFSPLSMTSLQMNLPERPHRRQIPSSNSGVTERHLPIPQPSPAQSSRNVVDQLQDQRLRGAQTTGGGSSMAANGTYSKASGHWNSDAEGKVVPSAEGSSGDLGSSVTASATLPSSSDSLMCYIPETTSINFEATATGTATDNPLMFSTSTLLDPMTMSTANSTPYSTFRDYNLPTTSSSESFLPLARVNSQSNSYSFDNRTKRSSLGGASVKNGTLASGDCYEPLAASNPHQTTNLDTKTQEPYGARNLPLSSASMSNLNTTF